MTGTIELDRDGHHLLISFPYREDLVEQVRMLPGRRWDRASKRWRVPAAHAETVVGTFLPHGFEIAPEVSSILAGTTAIQPKETKPRAAARRAAPDEGAPLTISALNERVRDALLGAFPGRVQVVGEVVEFDKNQDRKHIFFALAEKAPGGRKVKATVEVALFERTAARILPALAAKGLVVQDGIEILIEARVDFYPASGRFQLIVEDIKPEFTLGKLALSREQILEELRQRDLIARNRGLPMPVPCLRVGVLTSPDADGWNDLREELARSGIGFEVGLFPIRVQGPELKPTVLEGLTWFADHAADWDVLCIVRGGGSRTDLAWFDDREIALAVAQHPLKIVCGIGHERDRTVLDEITHSEKTPTAVGGLLIGLTHAAREQLRGRSRHLAQLARDLVQAEHRRLARRGHELGRAVLGRLASEQQRWRHAAPRLARCAAAALETHRRRLAGAEQRLRTATRVPLRRELERLGSAVSRLVRGSRSRLKSESARIGHWTTRQRLLDPTRVLERGFALVRESGGAIVTSALALTPGDRAIVILRDGRVATRVENIETTANHSD